MKNNYYVDLNVIYPFFDYLAPKDIGKNKKDMENRKKSIINFLENHQKTSFLISKSVYIEWFQKMIEVNWDKTKQSFNQFIKTNYFQEIINKFKKVHKYVSSDKSIFKFDWNFKEFLAPKKQSWDHFHITMRSEKYKFITFDKKFSENKSDFILIKKN